MRLGDTIDRMTLILPDFVEAMIHGDEKRAMAVLDDKGRSIRSEIVRRTKVLHDDLDAVNIATIFLDGSMQRLLEMRLRCGWQPTEEQRQAMQVLGIELESEVRDGLE